MYSQNSKYFIGLFETSTGLGQGDALRCILLNADWTDSETVTKTIQKVTK
jgi:hypothetical protein